MIDEAIELLELLKKDIENNKPLCPFPRRDLIYSIFLNNNGTLKEEFIKSFSMGKTDDFYKVISIMGTACSSSGTAPNDKVDSMKGSINRKNLIIIINEMLDCLISNNKNNKDRKESSNVIMKEYDVFISHANKDKKDFVEELYQSLSKLGINIFYDKESLEWGDNWKNRILEGTKKAEFAIIVISENFFDREWTERELSEFLNLQNENGQKIILPILYNITIEKLREKYPSVADIQAIDYNKYDYNLITIMFARQLIKRLKSI